MRFPGAALTPGVIAGSSRLSTALIDHRFQDVDARDEARA
jgi:hypothetical protein